LRRKARQPGERASWSAISPVLCLCDGCRKKPVLLATKGRTEQGAGDRRSLIQCAQNAGVAADPPRNKADAIALRPRVAGSSFFWATQLMSYERREAMYALYDLCHEVDDIDDGDASRQPRRARPAGFQNAGISKCSRLASESVLALRPSSDWLRA